MRKMFFTVFASALVVPCLAEVVPALLIKTTVTEHVVALSDIGKVAYTETDMVIVMKDGSTKVYPMDDVKAMTFANTDISTSTGSTTVDATGKAVIYSIDGIRTDNTVKKGIYIIKEGKETRKIVK